MVTGEGQTNRERLEWDRRIYIEQALAAGEREIAEWLRTAELESDESTAAEDAEDARVAVERIAKGDFVSCEAVERELDYRYPEDAVFLGELAARYPRGCDFAFELDPECAAGRAFFARLGDEWPEAVAFFLADD